MKNETFGSGERPSIHLLASESDQVAALALRIEHRQPVVAAMLLEEIERAELHELSSLPADAVGLRSKIDFIDGNDGQVRKVTLVVPADADISKDRVSILTPIGAALYGLRAGSSIRWPDLEGNERQITILRVVQPTSGEAEAPEGPTRH